MSNPTKCGCGHWTFLAVCPECGDYIDENAGGESISGARSAIQEEQPPTEGIVTVTCDEGGQCVAVTRNDEEGRIISVIWEQT